MLDQEIKSYEIMAFSFSRGLGSSDERRCLWDLCGKSVLQWTFEPLRESKYVNKLVIRTEDLKIARAAERLGVVPLMLSVEDVMDFPRNHFSGPYKRIKPRSLIHGNPWSWVDRHRRLLCCLKESMGYIPDLVLSCPPDLPLVTTKTIDRVIEGLFKDEDAYSSDCVHATDPKFLTINPTTNRLISVFIDNEQSLDRQLYPPAFKKTGLRLVGASLTGRNETAYVVAEEEECISVHTKKDLAYASYLIEKKMKGGEKE